MSEQAAKSAKKVRRIVDTIVTVDIPSWVHGYGIRTPEEMSKRIREWVKEQRDFLRDHRSRDGLDLSVEDQLEDQCSACGNEWETMEDEIAGGLACAHCGSHIEDSEGISESRL